METRPETTSVAFFLSDSIIDIEASLQVLEKMAPPFRAEHMGSLLRPQKLLDVRATIRDDGKSEEDAGLPSLEKQAVADVVKLQRDLGFRAVSQPHSPRASGRTTSLPLHCWQGSDRYICGNFVATGGSR